MLQLRRWHRRAKVLECCAAANIAVSHKTCKAQLDAIGMEHSNQSAARAMRERIHSCARPRACIRTRPTSSLVLMSSPLRCTPTQGHSIFKSHYALLAELGRHVTGIQPSCAVVPCFYHADTLSTAAKKTYRDIGTARKRANQ